MRSTRYWPDEEPADRPVTVTGDQPAEPVIDLGDRTREPAAGSADGEEAPVGGSRRAVPRRYLVLAGMGLVAVGFVGGIAVQRAAAPPPTPKPSPAVGPDLVTMVPDARGRCSMYKYRAGAGWRGVDSSCAGVVRSATETTVVLDLQDGGVASLAAGKDTTIDGAVSVGALRPGQYVVVQMGNDNDGEPQIAAITVF